MTSIKYHVRLALKARADHAFFAWIGSVAFLHLGTDLAAKAGIRHALLYLGLFLVMSAAAAVLSYQAGRRARRIVMNEERTRALQDGIRSGS